MSEAERLSRLQSYDPESLRGDPELTDIVRFAARLADAPTALVSLVEEDRQTFLAREGLDVDETPRDQSFCQFAMRMGDVMEVRDARADPRFADNPLVTGAPHIRFYAGAPLVGDDGEPLGALCIISPDPRPEGLDEFQRDGLKVLAGAVMRRLKDRRSHVAHTTSEAKFHALSDAIPQMAWSTRPDGKVDYFNERWEKFTGVPVEQHLGDGWFDALHPDDIPVAQVAWAAAVSQGAPYEVEYRMRRHDGEWRWTLARGLPMIGPDGEISAWFGTNTDIHERKLLIENQDLLTRELSHRIKNIFSVVSGLFHLEARANPEFKPVAQAMAGRIGALSRAHDYVRPDGRGEGRGRTSLKNVLGDLFAPYADAEGEKVAVDGDDFAIREDAVTPLALLFHELATNAAKYGALSVPGGTVTIGIAEDGGTVRFRWAERGGPDATGGGDQVHGFGNQLISSAIEKQLEGRIERRWTGDGLTVDVDIPKDALA